MVIYLDIIFGINVLFNFLILMLTNYITRAYKRMRQLLFAAIFASLIVPLELMVSNPAIHSLLFKWGYCLLIILFAFGYNGFYPFMKKFSTFIFVMFTVGGGIYGIQLIVRESDLFHQSWLLIVKNINGEPISLLLLFLIFPLLLLFMKGKMDKHVEEKMNYDQICEVAMELDHVTEHTSAYIDSGNQLTDPFSGKPVVICDQRFLRHFFHEDEWAQIVTSITTGQLDQFPDRLQSRLSVVPYQGVSGNSDILYTFKPDKLKVAYEGSNLETSSVLIGIQLASLTVDESYHCLLHPALIRLKMKQSA